MSERQDERIDQSLAEFLGDRRSRILTAQEREDLHDVYLSYSPVDSEGFGRRVCDRLRAEGFDVWVSAWDSTLDSHGMNRGAQEPHALDEDEDADGSDDELEKSNALLLIISPDAVHRARFIHEFDLALQYHKRIIPILHLEQIERTSWQARHPQGTDEEWNAFQGQGLHTSYTHLTHTIRQLNWVMARQGIDDESAAIDKVLERLKRRKEYFHQHTMYLTKALEWDRKQRRSPFLLHPEVCDAARQWLTTRFGDRPLSRPVGTPTNLHAEYITESLKRAEGGMTQVFLSYAEEDHAIKQRLQRRLIQEGITVWSSSTDIRTGEDFQEAINRGIEQADNVVMLMSPHSLASAFCQQEIRHAQLYHKRIIPLLIAEVDPNTVPAELQTLQFVDFLAANRSPAKEALANDASANDASVSDVPTHRFSAQDASVRDALVRNASIQDAPIYGYGFGYGFFQETDEAFQSSVNTLLKVLQDDAEYYHQHKTLLVKALAWDTQERRKDLLLRGNAFVDAENWLAVSQQTHKQPPPTRLHISFVHASQEINRYFDAFISYGRADSLQFAIALEEHLSRQGFNIWFDKTDIPLGVDFQEQINDGISKSHNFLFIISPHAVNSVYCKKEIDLAIQLNKRIIPLLHVEGISYDTWKDRNPGGTEEEWERFKAEGRHSVFPNMPPTIGKINWVYFREGIDPFAPSLGGLVDLFRRHQTYVEQHTLFLINALDWEVNQRKTEYLLVGDERLEAEQWLKTQFVNEQPPCRPTHLHAEFICESIKNANNLMTQVFISHSEQDSLIRERVRYSLMEKAITVWINRTDITTGTDFQEEINQGIEETDNVVWLMSPASLQSAYCRQELEYALYLNKRIIPLLIDDIDMEDVPLGLRSLQFIDVRNHERQETYDQAMGKLLKALDEDARYHTQHKLLLVRALRWKQQKYNPSILLRGFELRHFQSWFQVAQQHQQFRPIPLQEEFIAASEQQPPDKTLNVFMCYSRTDADFARKLNTTLQIQGMTTWFDQENIESGVDFQREIFKGIENSENFLFVISPSSVTSSFCKEEVEYAEKLNKRIVPVLYREVSSALLPLALSNIQWIDFRRHGGDFLSNFGELLRTLASDPEHVQLHTRLLVRSREWHESERDDSFLMRGKDLERAIAWLHNAADHTPRPTQLQKDYISASEALPRRRVKPGTVVVSAMAATVVVAIARFFGLTEGLELMAYDHLLRLRPGEPQDDRITLITVDSRSARDLREQMLDGAYEPGYGTIPDGALAEVLTNLQQHNPRLIGLDFYRDFPADPVLAAQMQQMDNLIAVCKHAATGEAGESLEEADGELVEGYTPPPELPIEQIGFTDFADDGSGFVRRHYLMQSPDPIYCETWDAFSLVMARRYLEGEGASYQSPLAEDIQGVFYSPDGMMFGDTPIPMLTGDGGGYRNTNFRLQGYQTMLNYRVHQDRADLFARSIPFREAMNNTVDPSLVRDRIVLIGYTDSADINADYWDTPYGQMPGVYVQGQMISQVLSAVLDRRPLIWWWPLWGEHLWTGIWAVAGGFILWGFYRPKWRITAGIITILGLYGTCYIVLASQAGWLALVPAGIALTLTGTTVILLNYRLRTPR